MRRALIVLAGLALGLAVVAAAGALWLLGSMGRPYGGWSGERVDVLLEPGLSADAMLRRLESDGVLRDADVARLWLRIVGGGAELHAGEYRFDAPVSPRDVLARLRAGDVLLHPVTIPEGLTRWEIAERMAETGLVEREAVLAAFDDPAPVADLAPRAESLEGFLYPDTYHFARGVLPQEIAAAMVRRFREAAGPDFAERARAAGLEPLAAVVLASMIEKETDVPDERRTISQVFHNRLRRGMRMQCDPTVLYALRREGREVGVLTRRDLAFESPWNTYVSAGLPPGPIASPGEASLEAALDPSEGRLLYFVARPGGGHTFSPTLSAHERAVREWRSYVRSSR